MIETTKGQMDETLLKKQEGTIDNENETTSWVEYWSGGNSACEHVFDMRGVLKPDGSRSCLKCDEELVHRSVNMKLKKMPVFAKTAVSSFK